MIDTDTHYDNHWIYEKPIWFGYCKNHNLFGILPKEIIEKIIDIVIKFIIQKREKVNNLRSIQTNIKYMFDHNIENYHLDKENINFEINIIIQLLINISIMKKKPIIIEHLCCNNIGVMFHYVNNPRKNKMNFYSFYE